MKLNHFANNQLKKYSPNREYNILFSGGVDSLAIAHFLSCGFGNKVTLWHFNHKLKGDDLIEEKCREFAREFGLEIWVGTNIFACEDSKNLEAFCRDCRYEYFSEFNKAFIACHHLDDAVENYVANCFRGQQNYKPIPEVVQRGNATIVRPFLLTKKADMIEYVKNKDLLRFIAQDPYSEISQRKSIRDAIGVLASAHLVADNAVRRFYVCA